MQRAAPGDGGPHDHAATVVPGRRSVALELGEEGAHVCRLVDGDLDVCEADLIEHDQLRRGRTAVFDLDDDGALRPLLRRAGGAALEVAGVHRPRLALERVVALVDVPEGPVLVAGAPQVLDVAGAVVLMAGGRPADVGVEETNLETPAGSAREPQREVLLHGGGGVADAVHDDALITRLEFDGLDLAGGELVDQFGEAVDGRPAMADGVVVAVDEERADADIGQAGHAIEEGTLSADPALGTVVDVSGQQDEGDLPLDRRVHQGDPSLQRRLAQGGGHVFGEPADGREGGVEVEVCGVEEGEGHGVDRLVGDLCNVPRGCDNEADPAWPGTTR